MTAKGTREERVVSHFDNREHSQESMRAILRFAQGKVENGLKGEFALDDIARAKDFYFMWRRKKPFANNGVIGFITILATLIFSFTSHIELLPSLAMVGVVWTFYIVLENDKRKIVYIREMLGNMNQLDEMHRHFYFRGIRESLWGVESEDIKKIFTGITFAITIAGVFLVGFYEDEAIKSLGIATAITSALIFFIGGAIHEKRKVTK